MYIPYGGLKAIQDERVEHYLRRAELRRLGREETNGAGGREHAHARRSRSLGLGAVITQVRTLILGISI